MTTALRWLSSACLLASLVSCQAPADVPPTADELPSAFAQTQAAVQLQQQSLVPSDLAAGDRLGSSVSLSADGKIALVGAPLKNSDAFIETGGAYLFERGAAGWVQTQKLLPPDQVYQGDRFGSDVTLSDDGSLAFVGAPAKNFYADGCSACGAVYVFARQGGSWAYQQEIRNTVDSFSYDRFGSAISISSDNSTLLIAAASKNTTANSIDFRGAVYAYTRDGSGQWVQQQKLLPPAEDEAPVFGSSTALSADGSTAIVGDIGFSAPGKIFYAGAVYVFVRSGSSWVQQARLDNPEPAFIENFGQSVALTADGNYLLVGAPKDRSGDILACGAVMAFARQGSAWTPQQTFFASDKGTNNEFGFSVAITPDGTRAVIGARGEYNTEGGFSYQFALTGGVWTEQRKLVIEGTNPNDEAGSSVALSSSGRVSLVGASQKGQNGLAKSGAAVVYELQQEPGEACTSNDECTTGSCVSGVCCVAPCGVNPAGGAGGTGGSDPAGAGGSDPAGAGGSDPAGAGGSDPAGAGGSGPNAGSGGDSGVSGASGEGGGSNPAGGQGGSESPGQGGSGGSTPAGQGGSGGGDQGGSGGSAGSGQGGSGGSGGSGGAAGSGTGGSGTGGTGAQGGKAGASSGGTAGNASSGASGQTSKAGSGGKSGAAGKGGSTGSGNGAEGEDGGCGCRAAGGGGEKGAWGAGLLASVLVARRRRKGRITR